MKLIYFDLAGGRGEDCRIALHLTGRQWDDERITGAEWMRRKPTSPWGGLPVLAVDGKGTIGQSNAILLYIGRGRGLHPEDPWEAARHEALMAGVEDFRYAFRQPLREKDPERRKALREVFTAEQIPVWGARFEREVRGPFVAGDTLQLADLKLFIVVRWLRKGILDHIPTTCLDAFPRLLALQAAVENHPGVQDWLARA